MEQHTHDTHQPDCKAIVIIRFPADQYQRCKNALTKHMPIHTNYSDGEVQGIANHKQIDMVEGCWPADKGIAFLTFDSYPAAERWTFSVPEIKQPDWLGGVDMVLVPCCDFDSNIQHDFIQVLDLDISDTDALRRYYSGEASGILKKHNARQIVSTSAARNVKGQMHPKYLIINTWESEECFQQAYCGEDNQELLQRRQSHATTNSIVCKLEPLIQKHC